VNSIEVKAKMAEFRATRVGHRSAAAARDSIMQKLGMSEKERMFVLIGPSGVGKSTVLRRVRELILKEHREQMLRDPGFLPFISVKAVTGLDGNYSWRDGFARLLNAGNEPLLGKKVLIPKLQLDGLEISNTRGLYRDEFRRSFESMVKNRGILYVFVDEASAILDAAVNRDTIRHFNILKSLSGVFTDSSG